MLLLGLETGMGFDNEIFMAVYQNAAYVYWKCDIAYECCDT